MQPFNLRNSGFQNSIKKTLRDYRSQIPYYTLEQLAWKTTSGSGVCIKPDKCRPILLCIVLDGPMYGLILKFVDRIAQIHGLPRVKPDRENLQNVTDSVIELIQATGYDVRFIEIAYHFHLLDAIRSVESQSHVVGITIDLLDNL